MESSAFYQQENAHDFFSQLADATECIRCGDYDLLYRCMARLYNRILNGATANLTLLLSGAYAKTDYLLKKHGADKKLSLMVNDARIRFGKLSRLDLQEMRRWVS
ncbi:MAG: hypothetical protein K2L80_10230, partial [Muribaculaceae bacterium]|nr:hypothetical protein [Muribaculaceae bacterium]